MTRALVALFVAVQLLDLATYWQAPAFEGNPLIAPLSPGVVVVAKVAGVLGALLIVLVLDRRSHDLAAFALAIGIAVGALGLGSNLAILSVVNAAEAPRPAQLVIPAGDTRQEQAHGGVAPRPSSGTEGARTSAPPAMGVDSRRSLPAARGTSLVPASGPVTGRASWYEVPGLVAAAGPALRRQGWRGSWVRVSAGGRSVVVRLVDFCQCYRGERRERIIDLSPSAFSALAPLAAGVVVVTVRPVAVVPPSTDR